MEVSELIKCLNTNWLNNNNSKDTISIGIDSDPDTELFDRLIIKKNGNDSLYVIVTTEHSIIHQSNGNKCFSNSFINGFNICDFSSTSGVINEWHQSKGIIEQCEIKNEIHIPLNAGWFFELCGYLNDLLPHCINDEVIDFDSLTDEDFKGAFD